MSVNCVDQNIKTSKRVDIGLEAIGSHEGNTIPDVQSYLAHYLYLCLIKCIATFPNMLTEIS